MVSGITVLALMTGVLATGFAEEERRREYLRVWEQVARVPMFAALGVVTLSEIVGKLRTRYYPPASSSCAVAIPAIRCSSSPSGEVEVRLPAGGTMQLGEGAFFGEMALLDRQPRSATVGTTRADHAAGALCQRLLRDRLAYPGARRGRRERGEAPARREQRSDLGRTQTMTRCSRHCNGPLRTKKPISGLYPLARPSPSAISRPVTRPRSSAERPLANESRPNVAHHARDPGRRLRQAPVAAVAREHAQAVRAAARQAVDLPADAAARGRPQPVRQAGDRHQRRLPLHGRAAGQGDRHRDRHPGRAVAPRFRPGDGRRRGLLQEPGRQGGAGAGVRPSGDRRRGIPRRLPRGPGRRRAGRHRDLRHSADGAQDRLRLHPSRQRAYRPRA